jgi:hypothetical protein
MPWGGDALRFASESSSKRLKATLVLCAVLIVIAAVVLVGLRIIKATRLWPAALLIVSAPLLER